MLSFVLISNAWSFLRVGIFELTKWVTGFRCINTQVVVGWYRG